MTMTIESKPRPLLDELVHWIQTLTAAGVSPDKAADIASSFFLVPCEDHDADDYGYDDEDADED